MRAKSKFFIADFCKYKEMEDDRAFQYVSILNSYKKRRQSVNTMIKHYNDLPFSIIPSFLPTYKLPFVNLF